MQAFCQQPGSRCSSTLMHTKDCVQQRPPQGQQSSGEPTSAVLGAGAGAWLAVCGHVRQHPGPLPGQPHARLVPPQPPHPHPPRLRHCAPLVHGIDMRHESGCRWSAIREAPLWGAVGTAPQGPDATVKTLSGQLQFGAEMGGPQTSPRPQPAYSQSTFCAACCHAQMPRCLTVLISMRWHAGASLPRGCGPAAKLLPPPGAAAAGCRVPAAHPPGHPRPGPQPAGEQTGSDMSLRW